MKCFSKCSWFVFVLFMGCASSTTIQKNMSDLSLSMAYVMDSRVAETKDSVYVRVDTIRFDPAIFSDTTKVKRLYARFVPLVLMYEWRAEHQCRLGKGVIEEDLPTFMRASLVDEMDRSGQFLLTDLLADSSAYSVDVSIEEVNVEGPYVSSGFFYFIFIAYGYAMEDQAGPANCYLKVSYRLKQGDQVVHSREFGLQRGTEQLSRRYTSSSLMQRDYAISMVEALSYDFKLVNEMIVGDLNRFFNGSKNNVF